MINESAFRLKKNGEPYSQSFCRNPELIENYAEAIADTTQMWTCHHKFENLGFSGKQLVNMGMYYDVEPKDLVFMRDSDHRALHNRISGQSEESRKKISKALSKKVLCVETEEIFTSVNDAHRKTGIGHISEVCNGKLKTAGKLHWKFYN